MTAKEDKATEKAAADAAKAEAENAAEIAKNTYRTDRGESLPPSPTHTDDETAKGKKK